MSKSCLKCCLPCDVAGYIALKDGSSFHKECFTCEICQLPMPMKFALKNGKYYHTECYTEAKNNAPKCGKCTQAIFTGEVGVSAGSDRYFHKRCFMCDSCGQELTEKYVISNTGAIYHGKCVTCSGCNSDLENIGYEQQDSGDFYCRYCLSKKTKQPVQPVAPPAAQPAYQPAYQPPKPVQAAPPVAIPPKPTGVLPKPLVANLKHVERQGSFGSIDNIAEQIGPSPLANQKQSTPPPQKAHANIARPQPIQPPPSSLPTKKPAVRQPSVQQQADDDEAWMGATLIEPPPPAAPKNATPVPRVQPPPAAQELKKLPSQQPKMGRPSIAPPNHIRPSVPLNQLEKDLDDILSSIMPSVDSNQRVESDTKIVSAFNSAQASPEVSLVALDSNQSRATEKEMDEVYDKLKQKFKKGGTVKSYKDLEESTKTQVKAAAPPPPAPAPPGSPPPSSASDPDLTGGRGGGFLQEIKTMSPDSLKRTPKDQPPPKTGGAPIGNSLARQIDLMKSVDPGHAIKSSLTGLRKGQRLSDEDLTDSWT